jgi:hypothetical protein
MVRRTHIALVALAVPATGAEAQRRQISLEATPVHGALAYGWVSPQRVVGLELGFGFPQIDSTLVPAGVRVRRRVPGEPPRQDRSARVRRLHHRAWRHRQRQRLLRPSAPRRAAVHLRVIAADTAAAPSPAETLRQDRSADLNLLFSMIPTYSCEFVATLLRVSGKGGWVFAPVPEEHAPKASTAWGRIPVHATVDGHSWATSVWREKSGRTLLAVPSRIRGNKDHDDQVVVRLEYSVTYGE